MSSGDRGVRNTPTTPLAAEGGQSSVEWTGLVLLLAVVLGTIAVGAGRIEFSGLAHSVGRSLLCAASLAGGCPGSGDLEGAYGGEVADLVRESVPDLVFGPDLLGMPVDFRTCRSPACANPGESGASTAGEAPTLFTRVIDCRGGGPGCTGGSRGGLYIHFWAYYPESASLRGVPVLEARGRHRHDWESFQVRIGPDDRVSERASSHAGYSHTRSVLGWPADLGLDLPARALERIGLRHRKGWGPASGRWMISPGSHAGSVEAAGGREEWPRMIRSDRIRLVPLEGIGDSPLVRPARFDPITPPWNKDVWIDPEARGTG